VYFVAAIVVALLALLVWRMLPSATAPATTSYAELLRSVLVLVREHPVLGGRMALGLLSMAQFSAMWTASSFLLARTYHFSDGVIGLFGLAGAAGALGAPLAGRLADRGHGHYATTAAWLCLLTGWGLLAWGNHNLTALITGMLVFDLGAQGAQISNQNKVYSLDPDARSRITTAYMVTYFIGGRLGSVIASYTYQLSGWTAVCTLVLCVVNTFTSGFAGEYGHVCGRGVGIGCRRSGQVGVVDAVVECAGGVGDAGADRVARC
jgi:predicted MFS family arabinose efflux permease